ncbi:hypothetical protein V1522DRAFT_433019 [Lipomyces starkeyi]
MNRDGRDDAMNIDSEDGDVYEVEHVNHVEGMCVDISNHVPGEEEVLQDVFGEDEMAVERNATRMEEIDEDAMVEEQVQSREIVQYGQGVIRRREDRSPDTSDGEGQGMEIVKRTGEIQAEKQSSETPLMKMPGSQ